MNFSKQEKLAFLAYFIVMGGCAIGVELTNQATAENSATCTKVEKGKTYWYARKNADGQVIPEKPKVNDRYFELCRKK